MDGAQQTIRQKMGPWKREGHKAELSLLHRVAQGRGCHAEGGRGSSPGPPAQSSWLHPQRSAILQGGSLPSCAGTPGTWPGLQEDSAQLQVVLPDPRGVRDQEGERARHRNLREGNVSRTERLLCCETSTLCKNRYL